MCVLRAFRLSSRTHLARISPYQCRYGATRSATPFLRHLMMGRNLLR